MDTHNTLTHTHNLYINTRTHTSAHTRTHTQHIYTHKDGQNLKQKEKLKEINVKIFATQSGKTYVGQLEARG